MEIEVGEKGWEKKRERARVSDFILVLISWEATPLSQVWPQ
jgi:hypothetical protein